MTRAELEGRRGGGQRDGGPKLLLLPLVIHHCWLTYPIGRPTKRQPEGGNPGARVLAADESLMSAAWQRHRKVGARR